jgi:hypothetical protein
VDAKKTNISFEKWVWTRLNGDYWNDCDSYEQLEIDVLALYRCIGGAYEDAARRSREVWALKVSLDRDSVQGSECGSYKGSGLRPSAKSFLRKSKTSGKSEDRELPAQRQYSCPRGHRYLPQQARQMKLLCENAK